MAMATTTTTTVAPPLVIHEGPGAPRTTTRLRSRRTFAIATAVTGLGFTLVALEGSWWWAVVRILITGAIVSRAMHVGQHRSRRAIGVVSVAIGLVATPTGGALVVSYLGLGWSARSVAGVLLVGGGLVLLVVGAVQVVTSIRGWWRLLAVPAGLGLLYVGGFAISMSVYATNVGRPVLGRETPADRGVPYIDASFTTSDGVTLSGWYIPSTNGAAVVLLHGASSTRSAVLDHAVVLAHHGYGVLMFDARGMGKSGGRAMDFGWYGERDTSAAVDYLLARDGVDPNRIAAIGESMGGEEAIGAMAADARIRAVVAEGSTNRVYRDWSWLPDAYGVRGRIQQGVHWLTYELTDLFTEASPPITLHDAVAAADRPVLLIAAGNVADEGNAARFIQRAAPDRVEVWVVPGAEHIGGLHARPAEWEQRVAAFLAATVK